MVRLASPLAPEDPAKFCNIFLRLASCTSAWLPKLVFLSAGTCVVGPQAGPCSSTCGGVCCLDGSCSAWCGQTQPHSLGGGPPRSGPSACLRAVRAPNQRNPKSGASAESKHVETQQLKPQEAPPF